MEPHEETIERHVQRLRCCDSTVARKAITQLVGIGQPAVPALAEEARHEATFVRMRALVALQLIGRATRSAVAAIRDAVTDRAEPH